MDIKASARSKHASSQRGRARHAKHPHPPKPAPAAASSSSTASSSLSSVRQEKSAAEAPGKKGKQLPSNWSRYEEEEEGRELQEGTDGLPLPKSKGADYRELLSPSASSSIADLSSGRKSMMCVRGMDFLTRGLAADNDFKYFETSDSDVPYFSLDLAFLSEELAKLDIAERLFIDPEFIPTSLCESKVSSEGVMSGGEDAASPEGAAGHLDLVTENTLSFYSDGHNIDVSTYSSDICHGLVPPCKDGNVDPASDSLHVKSPSPSLPYLPAATAYSQGIVHDDDPMVSVTTARHSEASVVNMTDVTESEPAAAEGFLGIQTANVQTKEACISDNEFQPQAAEVELDALLDMLESSSLQDSTTSKGSFAHAFPIQSSNSQVPTLHETQSHDMNRDLLLSSTRITDLHTLDSLVPESKENLSTGMMQRIVKHKESLTPDNVVPLDAAEDFDDWLDSL